MADAAFARTPAGAPKDGWFHRNRRALAPWLFLAPGVLFFLFYVIFPIFQSFNISLYKWDGLGEARYIGLQNYYKLFNDRAFETSLWNNLKWLVLYLLAVPAGLFIAIFLNQTVAGIRLCKSLFFFPFVISQVVVGLVFTWFYDPTFGLLNTIIGWFGAGPISVLGDPVLVTYGIIAAGLWPQTAYCMILYLTGLNAVDPEQVEAGRLDGARGWRMLWHVILPQLRPATFIAFVVTIIGALTVVRPHLDHDERRPVRIVAGPLVQTLVLAARDRRLPEVVNWGAPLPADTDCASLARAGRIDVTGGMLDEILDLSICPEAARSFPGQPGLVARAGGGEPLLPSFRYVREESGGDAGSLLLVFADRAHDLTYTARFDTDRATGVMTLRATLEAGSAVRVAWFAAPVLPAPALADEMIDFAGRWCGEFRPTVTPWGPGILARTVPGAPGTSTFPVSWFPAAAPPTPEAWHTPSTTAGPAATGWLPKSCRTAGARSSSGTPRIRSAMHRPASRPPRSTWCAPTAVSTAARLHSSGTCATGSCAFPGIEIETSASGGGRIDFGILARTHRVWLSDSNDALERLGSSTTPRSSSRGPSPAPTSAHAVVIPPGAFWTSRSEPGLPPSARWAWSSTPARPPSARPRSCPARSRGTSAIATGCTAPTCSGSTAPTPRSSASSTSRRTGRVSRSFWERRSAARRSPRVPSP